MNFPFFHQVIVAGGRDPKLLQIKTTDFDTDNGSVGLTISTFVGSTEKDDVMLTKFFEYITSIERFIIFFEDLKVSLLLRV